MITFFTETETERDEPADRPTATAQSQRYYVLSRMLLPFARREAIGDESVTELTWAERLYESGPFCLGVAEAIALSLSAERGCVAVEMLPAF